MQPIITYKLFFFLLQLSSSKIRVREIKPKAGKYWWEIHGWSMGDSNNVAQGGRLWVSGGHIDCRAYIQEGDFEKRLRNIIAYPHHPFPSIISSDFYRNPGEQIKQCLFITLIINQHLGSDLANSRAGSQSQTPGSSVQQLAHSPPAASASVSGQPSSNVCFWSRTYLLTINSVMKFGN